VQLSRRPRATTIAAGIVASLVLVTACGSDDTGYDDTGYDDTGYDDTGYDDTGYDDTGYDDTGYDDTGYDDTGEDTGDSSEEPTKPCAFPGDPLCPDTPITVPGPLFPEW
jgi:hypothetical protein